MFVFLGLVRIERCVLAKQIHNVLVLVGRRYGFVEGGWDGHFYKWKIGNFVVNVSVDERTMELVHCFATEVDRALVVRSDNVGVVV